MTDAERFQKAMQAILSVPPERAEEIKRETQTAYVAATKDRQKDQKSDTKNRK